MTSSSREVANLLKSDETVEFFIKWSNWKPDLSVGSGLVKIFGSACFADVFLSIEDGVSVSVSLYSPSDVLDTDYAIFFEADWSDRLAGLVEAIRNGSHVGEMGE